MVFVFRSHAGAVLAKSHGVLPKIPFNVIRDTFAGGREAYERHLVLVRPDQFVAWTADRAPADVPALLAKMVGRY